MKNKKQKNSSKTLYKKVGRRFIPCGLSDDFKLMKGYHLLHIGNGFRSYMLKVDPNNVNIKSWSKEYIFDKVMDKVKEVSVYKTKRKKPSKQFQKDYQELCNKYPEEMSVIYGPSAYSITEAACNAVEEYMEKNKVE